MAENPHEKILEELNSFINNTKILVEKVMKMRMDYKESQMKMLRLFNPMCIKILDVSSDVSRETSSQVNDNKKIQIKRSFAKKSSKVRFINSDTDMNETKMNQ